MIPQIFKNENLYDNIIKKYANAYNIEPYIIKAIIARESGFNPKAYRYEPHRDDASYGLMQILYKTARHYGFNDKPDKLYEPETNIKYGALHLSFLIKHYKNNISNAIASYNMGFPRPAKKTTPLIIKLYGKPQPDWIYANQPYVDYVLAYYIFYKLLDEKNYKEAWKVKNMIVNKKHKEVWKLYNKSNKIPFLLLLLPISLLFLFKKRRKI